MGSLREGTQSLGHICYALKDVWYAPQTHTEVAFPVSVAGGNGWSVRKGPTCVVIERLWACDEQSNTMPFRHVKTA